MQANKEQLQAINTASDRVLCLAGAGCGKTATMINRISTLTNQGIAPTSILALTFTNAAAAEMKERYERSNPGKLSPEFRTFHSFCYSILCKDPSIRVALGYSAIPEIISEEREKEVANKAKTQCKITLSEAKLANRESLNKKEQFQAELYDKAVKRLMKSENVITFDILNDEVSGLFASGHPDTQKYKDQYKYIFADEFQDTDAIQIRFLDSFKSSNFFFVGDCLQNIYSFRGTSNEFIKALSNTSDWEKIRLFTNYRSTRQICDYANKFSATYADDSYRIEMQGNRDGDKVITKYVAGPTKYDAIADHDIEDVLEQLTDISGTSAILCRTNKEVNAVTSYLKEQGIQHSTSKDTKIQKLLDCTLSDSYAMEYLSSYLSSSKYGEYIRVASQLVNPDLDWFIKTYGNNTQIKADWKKIKLLKDISMKFYPTNDKLAEIEKEFHLAGILRTDTEYYGKEFLQYVKDNISEIKSSELYVGTIHSVKGLEYTNVFILNVGSYSFRVHNEDEKNLFYVAITRAKEHLVVYKILD